MLQVIRQVFKDFSKEEDGMALTEYLILLGLLTTSALILVVLIGLTIEGAWDSWATWFTNTF